MSEKRPGRPRKRYESDLSPAEAAIARLSGFHAKGEAESRAAAENAEAARQRAVEIADSGRPRTFG